MTEGKNESSVFDSRLLKYFNSGFSFRFISSLYEFMLNEHFSYRNIVMNTENRDNKMESYIYIDKASVKGTGDKSKCYGDIIDKPVYTNIKDNPTSIMAYIEHIVFFSYD